MNSVIIDNKKYTLKSDLHTHTTFSDGKGSIGDNLLAAREKEIKTIGITDHGPGHRFYGIKRKDIPVMRQEIDRLNELFPDMLIKLGLEANIINISGNLDLSKEEMSDFDYIIAGYHFGVTGEDPGRAIVLNSKNLFYSKTGNFSRKLCKQNTDLVVKALYSNNIYILTHPGDKAPVDLLEIAIACSKTDTLFELNTRHKGLTADDIKTVALSKVKFIISSDAHSPKRVGDFVGAVKLALKANLDMTRIVNLEVTDI